MKEKKKNSRKQEEEIIIWQSAKSLRASGVIGYFGVECGREAEGNFTLMLNSVIREIVAHPFPQQPLTQALSFHHPLLKHDLRWKDQGCSKFWSCHKKVDRLGSSLESQVSRDRRRRLFA